MPNIPAEHIRRFKMPAKRIMRGSKYGKNWQCACCGDVPWFLESRPDGPDSDVCIACQCDLCVNAEARVAEHLGACGKRLARCDAWLRRDALKSKTADAAARNRAWSVLVREYDFRDLHVLFRLAEAGIISADIPSGTDETALRLFRHYVFGEKKLLRIQMSLLSPREKHRVANGHPSAWRTLVMELCRKHYAALPAAREAAGGKVLRKDRLSVLDIALKVIDRMRLADRMSSRWIRHGQPTPEMLAEVRRLARIVKDERRGRSKKWMKAVEIP
jgi:hypothetical protein